MSARGLVLEIVTPDGPALSERGVDAVVLRRRERRFELGSEIAIFPLHAPALIRIPIAPARYRAGGRVVHLALGGGFAEVRRDRVRVITPRCERIAAREPDAAGKAGEVCRRWRRESRDHRGDLVGYP
jgi:F0F1-type ATP synthase epsilon subunit